MQHDNYDLNLPITSLPLGDATASDYGYRRRSQAEIKAQREYEKDQYKKEKDFIKALDDDLVHKGDITIRVSNEEGAAKVRKRLNPRNVLIGKERNGVKVLPKIKKYIDNDGKVFTAFEIR